MGDRELEPIRAPCREAAIVHFEITIESIRGETAASSDRFDVAIVNARTGDVVIDSGSSSATAAIPPASKWVTCTQHAARPTSDERSDPRQPADCRHAECA